MSGAVSLWRRFALLMTRCLKVGGASRDRTGDLLVANQTLSQLSYGPVRLTFRDRRHCDGLLDARPNSIWWVWEELNLRPHPYQGCALTN